MNTNQLSGTTTSDFFPSRVKSTQSSGLDSQSSGPPFSAGGPVTVSECFDFLIYIHHKTVFHKKRKMCRIICPVPQSYQGAVC